MLLEALQDIHLGQPWIKFPSPFCAAVVGRSNISPSFKSIRFYSFWGWKCVRDTTQLLARILRGKGLQKKKPNMFTVGSSTSETFVLPVCTNQFTTYIIPHTYLIYIYTFIHTYQYVCMYVYIYIYIYGPKPWYPRYPKSWLANGCLFPSHPMSVLYYYIMLLYHIAIIFCVSFLL